MQDDIPKQRGIYSEILTTEDTDNLKLVSTIGPTPNNMIESNKKQKIPRAKGIKRKPAKIDELDEDTRIIGKNYYRNPDVNEGFYSRKREGVADPDPKVMEPFNPIPGKPPRKVVIDRQRKLFASLSIEDLLMELNINYRSPPDANSDWLPLEPFDDQEYDCRLPHEWIELGYDEERNFQPIPGFGL
jgi:dynein heavy chain